ncbi:DUF1254 domain-containing protein [Maritalea sp.]|uniref:DUF1254 domain-containing protein n=1 Tax=Maritalea sp. TaxID=2003361 RepID=UPI003EF4BEF5
MSKFFTHIFAGLVLGGIFHLAFILILPGQSMHNAWTTIDRLGTKNQMMVIKATGDSAWSRLNLDPAFVYAACQIDLSDGPVSISGRLPSAFWTASLIAKDGSVPYSTTSRTSNDRDFNIATFNPSQSRRLTNAEFELDPTLLIIKLPADEYVAIIRVLPAHRALAKAYRENLADLTCSTL